MKEKCSCLNTEILYLSPGGALACLGGDASPIQPLEIRFHAIHHAGASDGLHELQSYGKRWMMPVK